MKGRDRPFHMDVGLGDFEADTVAAVRLETSNPVRVIIKQLHTIAVLNYLINFT